MLAPEDMDLLQKEALHNTPNQHSEMFSIGATVLSAGTLNDLSGVYNYPQKSFNLGALRNIVNNWNFNGKYSTIFKSIVLNLVNENPEKRMSSEELWSWISKYKTSIEAREPFLIPSAP